MNEIILKGIPASNGITFGKCFILERNDFVVEKRLILPHEVSSEIARFYEALESTVKELSFLKEKVINQLDAQQAKIFDAHLAVLSDPQLIDGVIKGITARQEAAEYVFLQEIRQYTQVFKQLPDEYLRERASDIEDIGKRVLTHLLQEVKQHELSDIHHELVIVSHDLSPSDAVSMYHQHIVAFLTDSGGRTSHTAILAKSLGLPAVVGLNDATLRLQNGDEVIVDGQKGLVIVHPSRQTRQQYSVRQQQNVDHLKQLADTKDLPAETTDGKKVLLLANIELESEVKALLKYGAGGVGLFRTEFLYMNRIDLPSEEEQFVVYSRVAKAMGTKPVTIRTLDLGGDKFISAVSIPKEMTPFLGIRAIRFCLQQPDIFKTQLRAILRASAFGNVQMMYPMIAGNSELRLANQMLDQVKYSLAKEGIAFDENLKVGCMIEVPSAVMTADLLAKESDFFSIGTNDLIQYALAVDRVNEKTADLYEPCHPGIIRMLERTIDCAHNADIPVSICGEAATDPIIVYLAVAMGVDSLSMSGSSLLSIKQLIRSMNVANAAKVLQEVKTMTTATDVADTVRGYMHQQKVLL